MRRRWIEFLTHHHNIHVSRKVAHSRYSAAKCVENSITFLCRMEVSIVALSVGVSMTCNKTDSFMKSPKLEKRHLDWRSNSKMLDVYSSYWRRDCLRRSNCDFEMKSPTAEFCEDVEPIHARNTTELVEIELMIRVSWKTLRLCQTHHAIYVCVIVGFHVLRKQRGS